MTNEWISVEDKLPEPEVRVSEFLQCLVVNNGNVQWALFNGKTKQFLDSSYCDIGSQVTYWMLLPQPPIKETSND